MATSRVPNRYVERAKLVALLDRLFSEYKIKVGLRSTTILNRFAKSAQEHSDAFVISNIPRELTNVSPSLPHPAARSC